MSTRITVADVARHLNLSATTVGHVLNGRAEQLRISQVTQARVHEAARELGYRPNLSARTMRTGRFDCAALIQPTSGTYLPSRLLLGISEELHRHDMHLVISEVPHENLKAGDFLPKVVRDLAADGLLINVLTDVPEGFDEELQRLNTPAVWINTAREHDCVHPDDLGAAQRLTKHLLQMGHRKIAYARYSNEDRNVHYSEHHRCQGYELAMRAARQKPIIWDLPESPKTRDEFATDSRAEVAMRLMSGEQRPTAIIGYEIGVIMPFYHAALKLGLRVPGDLSLAVFHGELNGHIAVPFTTMHLLIDEVGKHAVQMLRQKIERPNELIAAYALTPDFFEGATCAPPLKK